MLKQPVRERLIIFRRSKTGTFCNPLTRANKGSSSGCDGVKTADAAATFLASLCGHCNVSAFVQGRQASSVTDKSRVRTS